MKTAINWNDVFGLEDRSQRTKNYKQNNVEGFSTEALADEMKTEQKPDSSVSETPSSQPAEDDSSATNSQNTADGDQTSQQDPAEQEENQTASDGDMGESGSDSSSDDPDSGNPQSGGDDPADGNTGSTSDSPAPVTPQGVNPNRSINGKIKLSQEIHNLINDMESTLETFEQISLKTPVVVKLRELKDSTELLLDTVASVPIEDTMVRYELFVRNYHELIAKGLKKQ